ncbi:MAG: FecCD family ABC transporter permease [Ruminococcus sp.]
MKNSLKSCLANNKKTITLYAVGFLLLFIAAILGIILGGTPLSVKGIISAFKNGISTTADGKIFLYVRLPRTAASLICGAALAVSGAVIQGVLANYLASPSIIGVNSGAGLAVTFCTAFGIYGGLWFSIFAFLGAFVTVMTVSLLARRIGASRGTLILLGVAVNSLLNAASSTVVTFVPETLVMSNDFKVGEFSAVTYSRLLPASVLIAITLIILFTLTNELDVLTLGDDNARALGMNTSLVRTVFLMLSAVLAGCAVSLAGLLSFVGLIVPHIVRRLAANKSSQLLPLCTIFGAAFVCLCDTAARTLFSPYEIPVGIIMAFLGVPFFVFILIKGKGGHTLA